MFNTIHQKAGKNPTPPASSRDISQSLARRSRLTNIAHIFKIKKLKLIKNNNKYYKNIINKF